MATRQECLASWRQLHEDVAFRVLAAGNYRRSDDLRLSGLHLEELSGLFVEVVKLARECGLVKLGTIAVDGTKIKANASRHKAMSYERMQKAETELTAQIDARWHVRVWWMKPKRTNRSSMCRPRSRAARTGSRYPCRQRASGAA